MFSKKIVNKTIKEYKEAGVLPDMWGKDAFEINNLTKISFLSIFKKIMDVELSNLKKEEEKELGSNGLKTDVLVVTWVDPSQSKTITKEGLEYMKDKHPTWFEDKFRKGYFTWKLR